MRPRRLAGVVLPLSSIRTRRDWGIGQITDLPHAASWVRSFGHTLLQILPPHKTGGDETSPYGACTAFALDLAYVGVESISDLDDGAISDALESDGLRQVSLAKAHPRADLVRARALKSKVVDVAFERFLSCEWRGGTSRAAELEVFLAREASWLPGFAAYEVLRSVRGVSWQLFPESERRDAAFATSRVRERFPLRFLRVVYEQWLLLGQWDAARAQMQKLGVELMGDLPFVVGTESADVWGNSHQFRLDRSLGAPPDGFTPEGQDWGLPSFNWEEMDKDDLRWLRARAAHASRLYDRFRLDHVVGLFRQWVKLHGQRTGVFDPSDEPSQRARGAKVLRAIIEAAGGADVIAEDLGVIPSFVRETMTSLGMPGYRVIPWERDDGVLRDPLLFPETSVVTWSTHDTPPLTAWWKTMNEREQAEILARAGSSFDANATDRTLSCLSLAYRSPARLALVLSEEVLGGEERINTPGIVGPENWTYRLPRTIEELDADPIVQARLARVRALVISSGRG